MVFGVKSFPGIFQQIMDGMLAGMDGAVAYIDDIFVLGKNEQEHHRNLKEVFGRIKDYGFNVKFSKCTFFCNKGQIPWLHYYPKKNYNLIQNVFWQ